jgi:hypothetical protein
LNLKLATTVAISLTFAKEYMRKRILIIASLAVALSLLSPLLARVGSWNEIRRWNAPDSKPFGHDRPIYLSIEHTHSFFDPLGLYGTDRLIVSDDGYAYILYFKVPAHPSKPWVDACDVIWASDSVTLISPEGLSISIDAKAILKKL